MLLSVDCAPSIVASLSTEYARIGPQFASIYCIPNNVETLSTQGTVHQVCIWGMESGVR
jgi:hypothetical protein